MGVEVRTENVATTSTSLAMTAEREMTIRQSLRFWPKAILFSFIISLAIIMEVCVRVGPFDRVLS